MTLPIVGAPSDAPCVRMGSPPSGLPIQSSCFGPLLPRSTARRPPLHPPRHGLLHLHRLPVLELRHLPERVVQVTVVVDEDVRHFRDGMAQILQCPSEAAL